MKRLLLFLLLATALFGNSRAEPFPQKEQTKTKAKTAKSIVYVCVSSTAYAYHKDKECRGLRRCTHEIKSETEKEAVDDGRSQCKICAR
jgi:hypothetical protein